MKQYFHTIFSSVRYSFTVVLLVTLLLLALRRNSFAQLPELKQDLRFENFLSDTKLLSGYVANVSIDSKGYLWACSDALYRFDGVRISKYSSLDKSGRGLKNNYCSDLLNDPYGRLWIGNLAGLCYYDHLKDSVIYLQATPDKPILFAFAFTIAGNRLWFVSNHGLCFLNLQTLQITFTSLTELRDPTSAFVISEKLLGIDTRTGFYLYDIHTDRYEKKNIRVNDIVKKGAEFWLAGFNGVLRTTDFSIFTPLYGIPSFPVYSLMFHPADKNKTYLWLATSGRGLILFNTETKQPAFQYTHQPLAPFSISSDNVFKLHPDNNDHIWIATEKGISMLQLKQQLYQTRFLTFKKNSTDNHVGTAIQDKFDPQKLWLACKQQGLIEINWQTKEVIRQHSNMESAGAGLNIVDMKQLGPRRWLLLYHAKILIWNEDKGIEKIIQESGYSQFNSFIRIDDNKYCITSSRGLLSYDLLSGQLFALLKRDSTSTGYSPLDLQTGVYDGKQTIWLSTRAGLGEYNLATRTYTVYTGKSGEKIHSNFLNDVAWDSAENIYCAGQGIRRFNITSKKFTPIETEGVYQPSTFAIHVSNGQLWANTNAGLIMVDLGHQKSHLVTISGLTDAYSFSRITKINNDILIGYRDGYAFVNSKFVSTSSLPSPPVIENVFVNNEPYIHERSGNRFPHHQNNIRISFTAFEFSDPDAIRFRYKLNPSDKDWNYTGNERTIHYSRLPPGNFELMIQSGNIGGWNKNSTLFHFVIKPAFWQTAWFRLGILLILIAIIFTIIRNRIKNIRKQAAFNQLIAETENKALRAQMNPHFIFNCMATADGLVLQNKKLEASAFLHKFSKLVRSVLENSMHTIVPLTKDLDALQLYLQLEKLRHKDKFNYRIDVDAVQDLDSTGIPPLLLQPFVENAILHGLRHRSDNEGMLSITILQREENLVCIVKDNGIGRRRSAGINRDGHGEHRSVGIKVTEARVKSLQAIYGKNHSVLVEDISNDGGTLVTITIPLLNNWN